MDYHIRILKEKQALSSCPLFKINQYNWGGDYRPLSYGRMGYLENTGLLLELISEEVEPLCTYFQSNDPVYKDSAVEAFVSFGDSDNYFNFEINSAPAMLLQFGNARDERLFLSPAEISSCHCSALVTGNAWSVSFLIPLQLIATYFSIAKLSEGDHIRCNFYKISENLENLHYASFAPINYPEPNFHLPDFFADGIIK